MSKPVQINRNIRVACLPNASNDYPLQGETVYLASWVKMQLIFKFFCAYFKVSIFKGKVKESFDDVDYPDFLLNINITVYNSTNCSKVFPTLVKDWNSQICAGAYEGKEN